MTEAHETYTLVTTGDLLIACIPTGDDVEAAIASVELVAGTQLDRDELVIIERVTLTDDEPEDRDRIVWSDHRMGWLAGKDGQLYSFAVKN